MSSFWTQVVAVAGRDLVRERRTGEVLWVTIPFGAVALLLVPLAVGADVPLLRRIGPGLFWVVVMLFGVLVAIRRSAAETQPQRDLLSLLGLDPVARFTGQAAAGFVLLLGFEVVVGVAAVLLYDIPLDGWPWLVVVAPLAAAGIALLGTLAAWIALTTSAGAALVPLLVAPLAVPLLLGATQALEGLETSGGILSWVLLMAAVVLVAAVAGVLAARPLQETQ